MGTSERSAGRIRGGEYEFVGVFFREVFGLRRQEGSVLGVRVTVSEEFYFWKVGIEDIYLGYGGRSRGYRQVVGLMGVEVFQGGQCIVVRYSGLFECCFLQQFLGFGLDIFFLRSKDLFFSFQDIDIWDFCRQGFFRVFVIFFQTFVE